MLDLRLIFLPKQLDKNYDGFSWKDFTAFLSWKNRKYFCDVRLTVFTHFKYPVKIKSFNIYSGILNLGIILNL